MVAHNKVTWIHDDKAVVYHLPNSTREAVDIYIEANLNTLRDWSPEQTLFTIQDLSSEDVELTPYLNSRLKEITDYVSSQQIYVTSAIVMQNDFAGQVMRVFGRVFTAQAKYIDQVFFTDMARAEEWLLKQQHRANTT